jgi:hypothetical protein
VTTAGDLVTHAAVIVEPAWRRQPQPIRVLHNGRFSLPAGTYRIDIDWRGDLQDQVVGLQIGRTGDVLQQWTVGARRGERWSVEFSIPVDAPFVGLRGSAELEQAIERLRFVPVSIVNSSDRLRAPAVIAASQSGPAHVFYYDTNAFPERGGFWVAGERSTRVTLSRPPSEEPLVLRVHSGPVPNRLHIAKFGWRDTRALQPEAPALIEVPVEENILTLEFTAEQAFVPRRRDPSSTDTRGLGVWVEVVK